MKIKFFFACWMFEKIFYLFFTKLFMKAFCVSKIIDFVIKNLLFNKQILIDVFPISPTI